MRSLLCELGDTSVYIPWSVWESFVFDCWGLIVIVDWKPGFFEA